MNFVVSKNAVEKAKTKIKQAEGLQLCLRTYTCPICAEDLDLTINDDRNRSYICTNCSFIWPPKREK